jgi:HK97 family phage prohead protease
MTDFSMRGTRAAGLETRQRSFREVELRAGPDGSGGDSLTFTGYASVFDTPYSVRDWLGEYREVIRPGSFSRTLADGADVPFKINHDGMTLARTRSGTMQLSEDSTGLLVEARLDPANPQVQALRSAMERGDIDEMSFGFTVTREQWSPDYGQRDIQEVDLNKGDVSAVNYGANPATAGAALRSRDIAQMIRDHADPAALMRTLAESLGVEIPAQPTAVESPSGLSPLMRLRMIDAFSSQENL